MGAQDWTRRRFVAGVAGTALLVSLVEAGAPLQAAGPASGMTLYDPRFAQARAVASRLGHGPLCAVPADPTELLLRLSTLGCGRRLRGVTTDAVPFCLTSLMPRARLTQRRIDRDLFVWSLESKA